jgi:hypothetical protein
MNISIIKQFVFLLLGVSSFIDLNAQNNKYQLIDSKSRCCIPFAYIKVIDENILERTDQDGYFSLKLLNNDSIQISHLAYKTIKTSYNKIKNNKVIEMDELPIEVNPIIISAESVKAIVKKAIDSSYKSLYTPMYYKCYRRDRIAYRDTLVSEAIAEIVYELKDLFTPSHGGVIKNHLENIKVYRNPTFQGRLIPEFGLNAAFSPINMFVVGASKEPEKLLFFSYQEDRDSIFIISINPRLDYKPRKRFLLKSGRVIINKDNGKIIRIETTLNPEMMSNSRLKQFRPINAKRYYYDYSNTIYFNKMGILSKVNWYFKFSFLENNPEKLWENYSEMIFINEKTKPLDAPFVCTLKGDTSLVHMNSKYSPNFEKIFNVYLPIYNAEKTINN